MSMPIRYYYWRTNHKNQWQPEGNLHGYLTAEDCKEDNKISINLTIKHGYIWTILEATPINYEI
jgi:hypothetical protein